MLPGVVGMESQVWNEITTVNVVFYNLVLVLGCPCICNYLLHEHVMTRIIIIYIHMLMYTNAYYRYLHVL